MQKLQNMRNKRLFVFVFMACTLLAACEKYEGTISGNVVYVEDGVEFPAIDAVITKIELKGEKEIVVAKEKTDSGKYVLNYISKGSWKVMGWLEIDDLVYEGASDAIKMEGNKKEVVNLVLMPVKNKE